MTERKAIVAWLRSEIAKTQGMVPQYIERGDLMEAALMDLSAEAFAIAADAIEAGQHLENKDG